MGAPRRFGASRQIGRIGRDLAQGFGLFALVGIPGLVFFALSRSLGITVAVQASALNAQWWTIPVLVLSAFQNGALEEIIIVGYLYRRLQDISWNQTTTIDWRFWLFSSILRGSYHLYQGIGPFIGNFAMGLLFAWWFQSRFGRKRIIPLIIAHTLIDTIAFVGYQFAPAALLRLIGLS
jgi:membrane protease YdiL (CAAX protease family)